ncbi:MAG: DUF2225 domain-containing protein [Firmicutes bacterium]|nr:DUF2225 domain-containing protein [Bacillota bacterium]
MTRFSMAEALYEQEEVCPVCGTRFPVVKVRKSRVAVSGRDSDFCLHYEGVNPNLYTIWVCPRCSYAAADTGFRELADYQKRAVLESLRQGVPYRRDFSGRRTPEVAVESYLLAAHFGRITRLKDSSMAGIYLRAAWFYRELGQVGEEREMLALALQHYRQAYDRESFPIGKMSELTVQYLMAELLRRLGENREAIQWFSRIVSDPRGKQEPQLVSQARDMWYQAREALEKGEGEGKATQAKEVVGGGKEEAKDSADPATVSENNPVAPPPPIARNVSLAENKASRVKVSSMVTLYTDQTEWLKELGLLAGKERPIDLSAVLRVLLDGLMSSGLEEELSQKGEAGLEQVVKKLLVNQRGL